MKKQWIWGRWEKKWGIELFHIDHKKNKTLALLVVLPYLLMFIFFSIGVFIFMPRLVDSKRFFTDPIFLWAVFIWLFFTIVPSLLFIYFPLWLRRFRRKKLRQIGQKKSCKILNIEDAGLSIRKIPFKKITVLLKGRLHTFKSLVPKKKNLKKGGLMEVLYDPNNPNKLQSSFEV